MHDAWDFSPSEVRLEQADVHSRHRMRSDGATECPIRFVDRRVIPVVLV